MNIVYLKRIIHLHCRRPAVLILSIFLLSLNSFNGAGAQETRPRRVKQDPEDQEKETIREGETIRVGTQLVNVLFSVTDKQNHYIDNLVKNEVTVLENGKQQEIFTFRRETDLPLTMAILVDVSASVLPVLPRLMTASSSFINSVMKPGKDQTALIQFDYEALLVRDLTSNIAILGEGLQQIANDAPPPRSRYGRVPPIVIGSPIGGTSIYDSIIATSTDMMASKSGRKTIILFTDGFDTTSRMKRSEAVEEAIRTETVIYAIGVGDSEAEGVNKSELNKICEPTGGRAFIPKNAEDLNRAFAELEQDLRQQYLLAYEPVNEASDGSFRKIEVRVPDRKGIRIRHRLGYYALNK